MKAVSTRHLSKTYWFYEKAGGLSGSLKALWGGRKTFVEAVQDVNLHLEIGERVGIIGPNGAGKTTTLKMLCGILHPTRGDVEVMGFVPSLREKEFLRSITFVTGQRNRLFWDLPAQDYFEFCRVVYEIPKELYQRNLRSLTELSDIGGMLNIPQRKLSAGQRKRCELVAALLHDPKVIFLDEPTNALDLINARAIREFIKDKGKEGRHTIILTSHNMADIEQVCDRVIIIHQGRIVFDGGLRNLSSTKGFKKQIRVVFNDRPDGSALEKLGQLTKSQGQEICLEVDPSEASSVASHLFSHFSIQDISITEVPLEKIIESIYRESTSEKAGR